MSDLADRIELLCPDTAAPSMSLLRAEWRQIAAALRLADSLLYPLVREEDIARRGCRAPAAEVSASREAALEAYRKAKYEVK